MYARVCVRERSVCALRAAAMEARCWKDIKDFFFFNSVSVSGGGGRRGCCDGGLFCLCLSLCVCVFCKGKRRITELHSCTRAEIYAFTAYIVVRSNCCSAPSRMYPPLFPEVISLNVRPAASLHLPFLINCDFFFILQQQQQQLTALQAETRTHPLIR